jgi:hypothetical protein
MGILDDAIREHLELKRQRGAPDAELKQLEDEAFGPPTRPGEPDFPESEESLEQSGNGVAAETAVAEAPSSQEASITPPPESPVEEPPAAEHPVVEVPAEPTDEAVQADAGEPGEPDVSGGEPVPESEEQTTIYDQTGNADQRLEDSALEVSDEETSRQEPAERPPAEEPPGEPEEPQEATASEDPIESLDTAEHGFPDEAIDAEPPPEEGEHPPAEEQSGGGGEEDVLADTPDFLKDAPEDEELWFEQGKPKDFDF